LTTRVYIPRDDNEHLFFATWLKARLPRFNPIGVKTIACYRNEKIGAVLGLSNRYFGRVELTLCADDPRCFTKGNILTMLAPSFMPPMDCTGLTAVVYKANKRVRKFLEGMGFVNEGTLRQAGPNGENLIIYGLLKSEYLELVKRFRPEVMEQAKEMVNG